MNNEKQHIFILGHMRCYSTLLAHLLGSHEEICGCYEMHQSYRFESDITQLEKKLKKSFSQKYFKSRFLLDKILHNNYLLSYDILKNKSNKSIFILRKPEDTLKSILNLGQVLSDNVYWYNDIVSIIVYYMMRLEALVYYASCTKNNSVFIEAEKILFNSDQVLEFLKNWLGLDSGISKKYSIYQNTGKRFYGDSSNLIKSGKIVKKKNEYYNFKIPFEVSDSLNIHYLTANKKLKSYCLFI